MLTQSPVNYHNEIIKAKQIVGIVPVLNHCWKPRILILTYQWFNELHIKSKIGYICKVDNKSLQRLKANTYIKNETKVNTSKTKSWQLKKYKRTSEQNILVTQNHDWCQKHTQ